MRTYKLIGISKTMLLMLAIMTVMRCSEKSGKKKTGLEFRLALEMIPETTIWEVSNLFRNELSKASPENDIATDEIKVDFYDRGSIGSERQLLESCYFGSIEIVQVNTTLVSTIEPAYGLLNLPYLFVSREHHQAVLNGDVGKEMLDMLGRHHLKGLGFYSTGFRNIFYKNEKGKPCADTREGFSGLKIRVMESPIMINSINAMGPSATPLPFSELYQSLKTGLVDGAENSAKIFDSYEYHETGCNCFTLTEHSTDQHILVANKKWFDHLAPKYRRRIMQVAQDITHAYDSIWDASTSVALHHMEEHHVTINSLKDKKSFIGSVQRVHTQFFDLYPDVPKSLYERIKNQPYGMWPLSTEF